MELLCLSTSSSFSLSNRSSSSGSDSINGSDSRSCSASSNDSVSGNGGGDGGKEGEDNGEVRSSYYDVKEDASNAKQDRSINNKYRASIIAEQMDVIHDRISNLPDEIIYRILSFLDMKYVIQTSALSKKWKHIWTSMPHLNLNSRTFRTSPKFVKFVNDVLSHRNHRAEVSAVELSFGRGATQFDAVVTSIVNYAYSHNVRKLTILNYAYSHKRILEWLSSTTEVLKFPQSLFSCHTLKHLTLATNDLGGSGLSLPKSAWDFPALETLYLSNMHFGGDIGDNKSLNLFSKCVNLKDLTLHGYDMFGLDIFNVCAPQLSNLTITDPDSFPKVFNMLAPKLENLTASVSDSIFSFLQLSTEDLNSLEKVNLSMQNHLSESEKERDGPGLQDLFQKLCSAKFLILDKGIIEVLSACRDQLSNEPCPFNKLKCLKIAKQKNRTATMPAQVRNYFLESSPTATFIMDLPQVPQKRSREEVDKGTMAKKVSKVFELKVPQKRSREEVDKGTIAKKALPDQLSHEPSPFNNLKCLNQTDFIPTMSTEFKNQLLESSPSATFVMDLPQIPHKRSRQEAENGTMANTLEEKEKEKQQTESVDEEKRMLEAKIFKQDEVIAEKKAMLEAMKVQHEKRMLEAKLQEKVIAEQKVMLETMKLQNDKKMLEEKIERQDKIIAEQKAMLKLQIETEQLGNIDS